MTKTDVVTKLREEAKNNKVADAVFHMFASRQRARYQVTIIALDYRMRSQGFEFDRQDYVKLLKFLASLGLGRLETDVSGRVIALKEVKHTLQSIGIAAVQGGTLEDFKRRQRYSKLVVDKPAVVANKTLETTEYGVFVQLRIGNNLVKVPLSFTPEEIAKLLETKNANHNSARSG